MERAKRVKKQGNDFTDKARAHLSDWWVKLASVDLKPDEIETLVEIGRFVTQDKHDNEVQHYTLWKTKQHQLLVEDTAGNFILMKTDSQKALLALVIAGDFG